MKKKKIIMLIEAAILLIFLFSNATATNIFEIKSNKKISEKENFEIENHSYVDPNIKLTRKHLPKLKYSIEQIITISKKLLQVKTFF